MLRKSGEIVLKAPIIPDGETTRYRLIGQESGKLAGYFTRMVNKILEEGRECYKVYVRTEFIEGGITEETTILEIAEVLKPVSYHRIAKSKGGKVAMDAKMMFEDELQEINIFPQGAMSFCLRGGPFIPKSKITFNVIMPERGPLKMYGNISKERITVPAGTFPCYKVQIVPDTQSMIDQMPGGFKKLPGLGSLLPHFMPSMYRWFSQEEPYYIVKAEGFFMSPSSTTSEGMIEELVSIESKQAL